MTGLNWPGGQYTRTKLARRPSKVGLHWPNDPVSQENETPNRTKLQIEIRHSKSKPEIETRNQDSKLEIEMEIETRIRNWKLESKASPFDFCFDIELRFRI